MGYKLVLWVPFEGLKRKDEFCWLIEFVTPLPSLARFHGGAGSSTVNDLQHAVQNRF